MHDLGFILSQLEKIVSINDCHKLAQQTGFVERSTSTIKGHEFLQALVVPNGFVESETLHSLAVRMHQINNECNLSASGLAQRMYTQGAERFMQYCFSKTLQDLLIRDCKVELGDLSNFNYFNRILIEDSTMVELHEKLSPHFQGRGGAASKAALKINLIFDFKIGQIVDMTFHSGNQPDQKLGSKIVLLLKERDLVIRDLGYYALKNIKQIAEAGAYFISRYSSNVDVFEKSDSTKPLELEKYIEKNMKDGLVNITVYLGVERYPVRFIACRMSAEATNQRRRAANRIAQRCGRKISQKKLKLMGYSIFITNIPDTILSSENILAAYRVRWKIELIFKEWKSCLKIHVFKGYKLERIHCLLYGRLIMVLITDYISSSFMQYAFSIGRELSSYKLVKYLISDHAFAIAMREGLLNLFLEKLIKELPRRLCMDKRKRSSLRQNAENGVSYYERLNEDMQKTR